MTMPPLFCLPIRTPLANDRVKLVPWDTDLHGARLVADTTMRGHADSSNADDNDNVDFFAYTIGGPFPTVRSFRAHYEDPRTSGLAVPTNPAHLLLAVVDKTRPASPEDEQGELAGLVGYLDTSPAHRTAEIGPVFTFPRFQGSHVTRNAVGLLLQTAFAAPPPAAGGGGEMGLGLVRVQWVCHAANAASARLAEGLGFEKVGLVPWAWRFARGKAKGKVGNGKPLPPGSDPDDVWRDTLVYTLGWDVWEATARDKVEKAMAR